MTRFSDFMLSITNTDDLMRQAQLGDPKAYMELAKRGEMIRPEAREQGVHGRPGGRPMPGLERPAYLDRGIARNMARPAGSNDLTNSPLPMMPAIFPEQQEAPDYLGIGIGDQPGSKSPIEARLKPDVPAGQAEITSLANGNDAAASIQRGAAAADQTAGVGDPTSALPEPIKALSAAFMNEEEQDPYEGAAADLMKDITAGINPERNKNMALAQAGFAMAASGAPYFLQGVGIGGEAGLKSYQEAQDRDTLSRIRAAQIGTDLSQTRERKRSNRATEALTAAGQAETSRANLARETQDVAELAERKRAAEASEGIARGQLGISSQNAATAAGNLKIAQDNFALAHRQYEEGKVGDAELQKAQTDLVKAQTAAAEASNLDRSTDIQVGEDNTLYNIDKRTNQATPIIGPDGKAIKAQPKSTSAKAFTTQYLTSAGWSKEAIADVLAGHRPLTEAQKMEAATKYASSVSATEIDVTQQTLKFNEAYNKAMSDLNSLSAAPQGATGTPAAGASTYKTPDEVKRDYQAGKIDKKKATEEINKLTQPKK